MSSSIEGGITALDNSEEIGDHGYTPLDVASHATSCPRNYGNKIASYKVPANKKFTLKSLLISVHPAVYYGTLGVPARAGTCKLRVNSTDKAEFYPACLGWGAPSGYNSTYQGSNARMGHCGLLHDGVQFAAGDVIAIEITLTTTTRYLKAVGWITGVETSGGADVEVFGRLDDTGTGAKTIVTYTVGANGFTMKSFGVECYMQGLTLTGMLECFISGRPLFNSFAAHEATAKTFSTYLVIPFHDGIEMYPGDRVRLEAADLHQAGNVYNLAACGDETDLGGGGATITEIKNEFPRCYGNSGAAELRSRVS
jgi:hypothetical protein